MRPAVILGLAEPLRAEPGSVEFHVHRDRADRLRFVIYEMFRSKRDLEKHLAEPYVQEFVRAIQPLVEGPLRQQFLRMCSDLPEVR
jgi:quinol monooxygenase YgiN